MHDWPWSELDIAPTADRAEIKRAYAAKLKALDRERDVEGFQALRAAYEVAMTQLIAPPSMETSDDDAAVDWSSNGMAFRTFPALAHSVDVPVAGSGSAHDGELAHAPPELAPEAIDAAANRLLTAVLARPDPESVRRVLATCPELDCFSAVDSVGVALVRAMLDRDDLEASVLNVLADRFSWRDMQWLRRHVPALERRIPRWLLRVDMRERLVGSSAPAFKRTHYRKLERYLVSPFGFWQAFRVGLMPLLKLEESVEFARHDLGSNLDVLVSHRMQEFHRGVSLSRFVPGLWFGMLSGRALQYFLLALLASGIALSVPGGNAPITHAHVALAGVVFVAMVLQSFQMRIQSFSTDNRPVDAFVYSMPITTIVTLQLFGMYTRAFAG